MAALPLNSVGVVVCCSGMGESTDEDRGAVEVGFSVVDFERSFFVSDVRLSDELVEIVM